MDELNDIENLADDHSWLHFSRDYYKKAGLKRDEAETHKANRWFRFFNSVLSSKQGSPVIDEQGNCTICGKGVDDNE